MSIILSLVGDGVSDDLLAPVGYRQVARISGKDVVRIFGTRSGWLRQLHASPRHCEGCPPKLAKRATADRSPTASFGCGFRKLWPLISGNSGQVVVLI